MPHPISLVQPDTFELVTGALVTVAAWFVAGYAGPGRHDRRSCSTIGIALQAGGCAAAAISFTQRVLPWWAPSPLVSTTLVLLLGATAIGLFLASAAIMGRTCTSEGRMRSKHELLRSGPFAIVRHPIYLALLLYLIGLAAALGHWQQLLIAMPMYAAGTLIRIREDEKQLRAKFGEEHARYVREVPALIPLVA